MRVTNARVKFAITRLIRQYVNDYHSSRVQACPLCNLFEMYTYDPEKADCSLCPNSVFKKGKHKSDGSPCFPCVNRGYKYPMLDMDAEEQNLIEFWKEVHAILPKGNVTFDLTPELKKEILKIARKTNKLKFDR